MTRNKIITLGALLLLAILIAIVPVAIAKSKTDRVQEGPSVTGGRKTEPAKPAKDVAKEEPKKVETKEVKTETPKTGYALIGKFPYTIPAGVSQYYNYGKMLVSAYEYPEYELCGKLRRLRIVPEHNNQTIKPTGYSVNVKYNPCSRTNSYSGCSARIAEFPVEREMLLVVTIDDSKINLQNAKVRWSFLKPTGISYCNNSERAVGVDIIKGAGVPEEAAQLCTDQIITNFGDGPVYPMLPQTVLNLCDCSGAPVDEVQIAPNQSWVIIRGFEPGISKVFVNLVNTANYNFPQVEYSVRWVKPIPPLVPDTKLRINITEDAQTPDPFIFVDQQDQLIVYKIEVSDETDYYQNPNVAGILPIIYEVKYDLRFRRDPLQDDPTCFRDAYKLSIDTPLNPAVEHLNRLVYECCKNAAMPGAEPLIQSFTQCTQGPTVYNHTGYLVFKAHQPTVPYSNWGDDHYFEAKSKSVDLSIRYTNCTNNRCADRWDQITDEATTIEFDPKDPFISGLEVYYNADGSVRLTNTGAGPVYEIYLEKKDGRKNAITSVLAGGANLTVSEGIGRPYCNNLRIERGDWIYYLVYSRDNIDKPVVAKQRKVRVQ